MLVVGWSDGQIDKFKVFYFVDGIDKDFVKMKKDVEGIEFEF